MTNAPVEWAAVAPPVEMQRAVRWLLWNLETRTKPDGTAAAVKVPYYIDGSRRRGDLDADDGRLVDYAQARAALDLWGFTGLGFALGDGWQGVDFDHCDLRPDLAALVSQLPGYVEVSPSRTGVHAIGYGAPFDALGSNASGIEAYARGRYFTFTGWALRCESPADLSPLVLGVLKPRHEAHRKVGPVQPRPPMAETGDRVLDELADALRYVDADDRDTWVGVGQALYPLGDVGYALWAAWSGTSGRFPGGDDLERWETFKGERTGYQAIFNRATAGGWKNPRKLDAAAIFAGSPLVVDMPAAAPQLAPVPEGAPVVPPVPAAAPVTRMDGQAYRELDGRQRAASLENVVAVIGPASGLRIVYDAFQDQIMLGEPGGADRYRPLTDVDYGVLRAQLGKGGFKPVPAEIMRTAVAMVAAENTFDSARAWVESLAWDGVERIDTAMARYFGCEDTPYTRAVGGYLFTALAGRALKHPLQADMAVILVGLQGARKTSAVAALAPTPRAFGEIDLGKRDDDLARRLRGKLVVEWSEMRGLAGRDLEGIKAWLSRRTEEWTPKYKEFATNFDRRCIVVGTANTTELLDDDSGERRMLPLLAGSTDPEALAADRAQLWAEGAVRFAANGVEWQQAETLARDVHAHFKVGDPWSEIVAQWLEALPIPRMGEIPSPLTNGARPVAVHDVAIEAIGLRKSDITQREEKRIGKILRSLGYEKKPVRLGKILGKRWVLPVVTPLLPVEEIHG